MQRSVGVFDYLDVSPEQLEQTLKQEMGWTRPPDKIEHMDCLLHEMPFYIQTRKFPELTPNTLYRCGLIRRGLLAREEALHAEKEELENPEVPKVLGSFLEEIGMREEDFAASVQDWRRIERFRQRDQTTRDQGSSELRSGTASSHSPGAE